MSGSNGVVTFDYATWAAQYPELATPTTAPMAQNDFNQAELYLDNTPCSPVQPATPGGRRETILYLLTSHIAALTIRSNAAADASGTLVGRMSNSSEGSVSAGFALDGLPGSAAWFAQTRYGLSAWQALAPYRTALYIAAPQIPLPAQSTAGMGFGGGFNGFVRGGAWR